MSERPKFFDDLAGVAGGAISALAGAKDEISAMIRARVDEAVRRLDLVKRDEFEAMAELAAHARDHAHALEARLETLEARLGTLEARFATLEVTHTTNSTPTPEFPGPASQI